MTRMYRSIRPLALGLVALALAACAARPPDAVSKAPPESPGLDAVRMNVDRYIGTEVRWGGVIAAVENRADETWVEVVRYRLYSDARPRTASLSDGRFIASFGRFVDPVVYQVGRPLTVVGAIVDRVERPIGEYDYLFPIVAVEGSYLWRPEREYEYVDPYYPPPWWYYNHWYFDVWYHYPPPYHPHRRPVPYKR